MDEFVDGGDMRRFVDRSRSLYPESLEVSLEELNEIIHQPVRLRLMAALVVLEQTEQLDFRSLATLLGVTDGNLGAHLIKLEDAGYIRVDKTFVNRKPRTYVSATTKGKLAFEAHVAALKKILNG